MKKLLLVLFSLISFSSFASTYPLTIYNNTPYLVEYQLITYPLTGGEWPQVATKGNDQGVIQLAPYTSITYNVPSDTGLPYNLINPWVVSNYDTPSYIISGGAAYAAYGNRFKWGKFKFKISTPVTSSANVGPKGDSLTVSFPSYGITVNWVTPSVITINM